MIKLIKYNNINKYMFINTEEIINNDVNNEIFVNCNIKFSFVNNINDIGKFNNEHNMVNLLIDDGKDYNYIPKIAIEITEEIFYFIKNELEKITRDYGDIIDYEVINNNYENTIKENVLRVEFDKVFDKWGCRIVYQDFDILERGEFKDDDIKVRSSFNVEYDKEKDILYILGYDKEKDDIIIVVSDEEKEIIEEKVRRINKKYSIEKRWRAEEGDTYYFIYGSVLDIDYSYESSNDVDNTRYELGNYFRTEELAEKKIKEIKELLLK